MSFDAVKRKQVLRVLPPAAVAGIPELQREALAARQPPMFVNQELVDSRMIARSTRTASSRRCSSISG